MKEKHEAFNLHAIHVEKDTKKSNSHHWTCKYCGKRYTSGATRLLQHLSKMGGQVAACKEIPQSIADEIIAKMRESGSMGTSASTNVFHEASNIAPSSAKNSTIGGSTSASDFMGNKRQRFEAHAQSGRQSSMFEGTGHVRGSVAFLRE